MKQDSGFRVQGSGFRQERLTPIQASTTCRQPASRRSAFTLVEMLVVVLIMALLMGILVRTLGGAGEQADKAATQAKIERVKAALEEFYAEYGQYPPVPFYKEKNMVYYDAQNKKQEYAAIQPIYFEYPTEYSGINAQWSGTSFLGSLDEKTLETEKRLFTFGLVGFLKPRYQTVKENSKYFNQNVSALFNHKQWKPYTPASKDQDRDLNAYKRWEPFLEGVIDGGEFRRGPDPGTDAGTHHINIGLTIIDAWQNELRYESLPPHQSYKIWSKGRNGKDEEGRGDDIGVFMNK